MDLLETDLTELKSDELLQAATLFQSSYKRLYDNYENQKKELLNFANQLEEFNQYKINIEHQNTVLKRLIFGKKSEKLSVPGKEEDKQQDLLPGIKTDLTKKRKKQTRARDQDLELVIRKYVYDTAPICECCSSKMEEMKDQYEKSYEITVIERKYVKVENRRQKYRCTGCHSSIVTAPGSVKLKKGSQYSPDFAVQVAVDKYADHLPLERQTQIMKRQGLEVKAVTLWNQLAALADVLHSVYKRLHKEILKSRVIHSDETSWRFLKNGGKTWWVWGLKTLNACYYKIHESRSGKVPKKLLEGFIGTLIVDGYGGYNQVALGNEIQRAYCWAHVRRKFRDLRELFPQDTEPILQKITLLYHVESDCHNAELRLKMRDEKSRCIIAELKELIFTSFERSLPKSPLRGACAYALKRWNGLTLFLRDGEIPLDNNRAENSLRNPVLGRKNHLGSKSEAGAWVTSIFYTIIESCKINGVNPQAYLNNIVPQLIENVCECGERIEVPLPHEWKPRS